MSVGKKGSFSLVATGELILGVLNGSRIRKVSSASFILTCLAVGRKIKMWVTLLGSFIVGLFSHLCATSKLAKMINLFGALMNHLEIEQRSF